MVCCDMLLYIVKVSQRAKKIDLCCKINESVSIVGKNGYSI